MRSCNDIMRGRMWLVAGILILFFTYLTIQLYRVQIIQHKDLQDQAWKKYTFPKKVSGKRGEIFDSHGNLLVGNMPCQDVTITPCNIKPEDDQRIARLLADSLQLDFDTVYKKVSDKTRQVKDSSGKIVERPRQYAMIARNIPLEESRKLHSLLKKNGLARNVHFHNGFIRYYPKGKLLANILGFTTVQEDEIKALAGVEKFFDKELRSSTATNTYMRSRDGRQLGINPILSGESKSGKNVYLTIVEPIQSILEEELDAAVAEFRPRAVYAIMADPHTGKIMAMAQRPSFDPNERQSHDPSVYTTRVISDVFEPGSIMKPLTVAGALDYGVVRPSTRIDCEKGVWFYRKSRLTDTHNYGMQDVTGVIRKSSNIGTAKIAIMMGEQRLYRTLRKFGLGSRSGLPLTPESRGLFRSPDKWDGLSISRFGMGYGVAITPVQMLRAYCALAARGKLPTLRLLDRIVDPETGAEEEPKVEPPRQIYSNPAVGDQIVNMMVTVTETGGTATRAAIPGYRVAGKTGTARKIENGHYVTKYFASFVGFVPAEKPAFVLLITFDEPHGSIYGGTVAGPVWRRIAERTLKYLNIAPSVINTDK